MHAHALCAHGILPNGDTESKEGWGQLVCRAREIEGSVVHLILFSVTVRQSTYLEVIRMPNTDTSLTAFGKWQLMVWGLRGSKNHIRVGEAEVWQAFWLLFKTNRMFRIKDTFYFKELGNVRPLLSNKSPRKEGRVQEGIFSLHFLIKVSNF